MREGKGEGSIFLSTFVTSINLNFFRILFLSFFIYFLLFSFFCIFSFFLSFFLFLFLSIFLHFSFFIYFFIYLFIPIILFLITFHILFKINITGIVSAFRDSYYDCLADLHTDTADREKNKKQQLVPAGAWWVGRRGSVYVGVSCTAETEVETAPAEDCMVS